MDIVRLREDYYSLMPDTSDPAQLVAFGTSGHRGDPHKATFNEAHIAAIAQAICDYRRSNGIDGPHFVGMDSHAVSMNAMMTALEVYAANGVKVFYEARQNFDDKAGFTPTPAVSFAIIEANKKNLNADGSIITPSHNPPSDGGFKYNPGNGGPADSSITKWIENRANGYLKDGRRIKRMALEKALTADTFEKYDFISPYVGALPEIIEIDAIKASGLKIAVDPMGGAALEYIAAIKDKLGLNITIVNDSIDMSFSFMPKDWDGKIRMDCSSPYAMKNLIGLKDRYDIAWGNDTDSDRHGIVTPSSGLLNPNHFLAVAVSYLIVRRRDWPANRVVGKTIVTTQLINRIAEGMGRRVLETPVGFKYFSAGPFDGTVVFGCEESAGASFLRKNGRVWTTDKDGIVMGLLSAEMTAKEGRDPGIQYQEITKKFGTPFYERIDTPASPEEKAKLRSLSPWDVRADRIAGEKIEAVLTKAPNGDDIGGLKVTTRNGWFAARPSGTEDVAKLYAESFVGIEHLKKLQEEAKDMLKSATA